MQAVFRRIQLVFDGIGQHGAGRHNLQELVAQRQQGDAIHAQHGLNGLQIFAAVEWSLAAQRDLSFWHIRGDQQRTAGFARIGLQHKSIRIGVFKFQFGRLGIGVARNRCAQGGRF